MNEIVYRKKIKALQKQRDELIMENLALKEQIATAQKPKKRKK